MTDVTIEYCVPCGFRERALSLQTDLLDRFERDLDSVALEPGHGDVFADSEAPIAPEGNE